jgi:hypothetical protein
MGGQIVQHHADTLDLGIMDIDKIAHAVGKVIRRAPRGDLHPASGAVGVEEDEQVGGAVALVLTVVAFQPARHGRDRLARLADELVGLSSKHTTGRLGSGISAYRSSTSSMRATYSASTLGCTTCPRATAYMRRVKRNGASGATFFQFLGRWLRNPWSEPDCMTRPVCPSQIHLIYGRLATAHQHPACGGQGSGGQDHS